MAKFLYIQDFHLKGKNSINRTGDYFSDCMIKFDEIISIAKKLKVDAIIDGGDLFDSPIVSYSVCDAVIDRIEKSGLTYHCLFGNHAERYHSKEHSFDTTLAHILRRSKNFRYLDFLLDVDNNVFIKGFEYNHNIEEEIKKQGLILDEHPNGKTWKIAIVHAFICPEPFPYASHVVCDDIKTNADLVLVAHYHKSWSKKVRNTQYLDIGCLGRNSITEANIEPSCVILDTEKRTYNVIKLNSAKRAEECFNLEKLKEIKQNDASLTKFIQSLESTNFQANNLDNIIDILGKENNFDNKVLKDIKNRICNLKGQ